MAARNSMGSNETFFARAGSWVGGQGQYKFDFVLLGPQGNIAQAAMGHVMRRITGENIHLMRVQQAPGAVTYLADDEMHVTVITLGHGEQVKVEGESLLAFTSECQYGSKLLVAGVATGGGLFTTCLTGAAPGAYAAVLSKGNPLMLDTPCKVDPDAVVAWTGPDPGFAFDLSWKNIIGKASGESYQLEFKQPGYKVIIQPCERKSGLTLGVDGNQNGNGDQRNPGVRDTAGQVGGMLSGLGRMLGGQF